jgi:phage protein D
MATVPHTGYTVTYNNKNITADISKYLLSLTYSDKTAGESDEVSIELEDVDGLWQNNWYPEEGAVLSVTIGRLNCGVFEIDEIEINGPPDTVTIRGMATGIKNSLRTRKSDAHENKTLRQIAEKIATKNNLTIAGDIPEITIGRVTQNKETDVAFLKRISGKYGVVFSVRGSAITFTDIYKLEGRNVSFTVDKTELSRYSIKDKADGMIKAAKVKSKNSKKNEKVEVNLEFEKFKQENPAYTAPPTASGNDGVSYPYAENKQQGEAIAKAVMHLSASNKQEGNISMQFKELAVAGNNFTLTGLGKLSGKYNIKSSSHKIDRSGATSELEIKRLQTPTKQQQITNKPPKSQVKNVSVRNIGTGSGGVNNPSSGTVRVTTR